jgi:hypothetical protein
MFNNAWERKTLVSPSKFRKWNGNNAESNSSGYRFLNMNAENVFGNKVLIKAYFII